MIRSKRKAVAVTILVAALVAVGAHAEAGMWAESEVNSDCDAMYEQRYGEPPPAPLACADWETSRGPTERCCIEETYVGTTVPDVCIFHPGAAQPPPDEEPVY